MSDFSTPITFENLLRRLTTNSTRAQVVLAMCARDQTILISFTLEELDFSMKALPSPSFIETPAICFASDF